MTTSRRQTVFASLDPPRTWPATRGRPQPQRLELDLDALPGVGVTLKRKLAKLGLATVRDLLEHRPRRYESAVDEISIANLRGADEVVITGEVLNVSKRPLRGRRTLVTARVSDGTAAITAGWFNQPWVADQLQPGVRVRLRGKPGRYGFDVKSYDVGDGEATADFAPVYPASEEISPKRLRTLVTHALGHVVDYVDPLPAELREREALPLKRDALFALHHPESAAGSRVGPTAARVRGAAAAPARDRAPRGRARAHARAVARNAGRADRALPPSAAVRAHAVPGAGAARNRRRSRAHDADAAAAAG